MAQDFLWQHGDRVVFLVDTVGEDPRSFARLAPAMITARYPERVIEYAVREVGGNRLGDVFARVEDNLFGNDPTPTWIVISLGINDVWHGATGTPLGRFRDLYEALLGLLTRQRIKLLCCTTTVISEDLQDAPNAALYGYNEAIRDLAFSHGAEVADMHAVFTDTLRRAQAAQPGLRFTVDDIHLNETGHLLMTLTLLQALHFGLPTGTA